MDGKHEDKKKTCYLASILERVYFEIGKGLEQRWKLRQDVRH
jgi:hypothetical protein